MLIKMTELFDRMCYVIHSLSFGVSTIFFSMMV